MNYFHWTTLRTNELFSCIVIQTWNGIGTKVVVRNGIPSTCLPTPRGTALQKKCRQTSNTQNEYTNPQEKLHKE